MAGRVTFVLAGSNGGVLFYEWRLTMSSARARGHPYRSCTRWSSLISSQPRASRALPGAAPRSKSAPRSARLPWPAATQQGRVPRVSSGDSRRHHSVDGSPALVGGGGGGGFLMCRGWLHYRFHVGKPVIHENQVLRLHFELVHSAVVARGIRLPQALIHGGVKRGEWSDSVIKDHHEQCHGDDSIGARRRGKRCDGLWGEMINVSCSSPALGPRTTRTSSSCTSTAGISPRRACTGQR